MNCSRVMSTNTYCKRSKVQKKDIQVAVVPSLLLPRAIYISLLLPHAISLSLSYASYTAIDVISPMNAKASKDGIQFCGTGIKDHTWGLS